MVLRVKSSNGRCVNVAYDRTACAMMLYYSDVECLLLMSFI